MTSISAPIIIDLSVIVLLAITIAYCYRLNKKIVELQRGKKELATLFKYFEDAIERAEKTVGELKLESQKASIHLEQKIKISKSLLDDFSLMITKCSKLMHNLEDLRSKSAFFEKAATSKLQQSHQQSEPPKPQEKTHQTLTTNKKDVMQTLASQAISSPRHTSVNPTTSKEQAIEDLLKRISEVQRKQSVQQE